MSCDFFSNQRIDITGRGEEDLKRALGFFLRGKEKWEWFVIHPKFGFVLFWTMPPDPLFHGVPVRQLPYAMTSEAIQDFILHWLDGADCGPPPDHDGSNHEGWRVYNEQWTHVGDSWAAQVAVQAVWAIYSK